MIYEDDYSFGDMSDELKDLLFQIKIFRKRLDYLASQFDSYKYYKKIKELELMIDKLSLEYTIMSGEKPEEL